MPRTDERRADERRADERRADERRADERAARRAWIAAHHPDRGGDPQLFDAGLRALDGAGDHAGHDVRIRPTVVRSRRPDRVLRRVARRVTKARRTRTHHTIS